MSKITAEGIVKALLTIPLKCKKGTDCHRYFGEQTVYITEISELGNLGVGLKVGKGDFNWVEPKELIVL